MPVSPILERQTTYPFVRLNEAARRVEAAGTRVLDFGMGDPREPTEPFIREALVAGLRERMGYPAAVGLPELREAISGWAGRRFGTALDLATEVIPTSAARRRSSPSRSRSSIRTARATRSPSPIPATWSTSAARFAHARPLPLPLRGARLPPRPRRDRRRDVGPAGGLLGQLPEQPDVRDRAALLLRAPGRAGARARVRRRLRRGVHRALVRRALPASVLQLADRTNVVVFNTLSKRSSMTGYGAASPPATRR